MSRNHRREPEPWDAPDREPSAAGRDAVPRGRLIRRLRAGNALTAAAALYLALPSCSIVLVSQVGALPDEALPAALGLPAPASPLAAAWAALGVYLFAFLSLLPSLGLWRKNRIAAAAGLIFPIAGLFAAGARWAGVLVPAALLALAGLAGTLLFRAARRALEEGGDTVLLPRVPAAFGGKLALGGWCLLAAVSASLLLQSAARLAGLLSAAS